ncbi:MAG: hypothetical protein RLZZ373_3346, partial [Pseudomonadota bacterium]
RPRWAPRMISWLVLAILLSAATFTLAPQQLPVSVYKLSLVATAAVAGYWIDRALFPYARPDALLDIREGADHMTLCVLMASAMLRRAIIVAAAMLATGLGA